jgi:hypothetical protein
MDERVWKSADEWRAAAPYAIHFQLTRANGQKLYVDELNWWPAHLLTQVPPNHRE